MYRPIVISPMRTSNNVRSAVVAPEFTNMTLYNDCYRLTISLHISEEVFDRLYPNLPKDLTLIDYKGRKYLHWEQTFLYETSFYLAFAVADALLRDMKVIIREAKVLILQDEIEAIKYGE